MADNKNIKPSDKASGEKTTRTSAASNNAAKPASARTAPTANSGAKPAVSARTTSSANGAARPASAARTAPVSDSGTKPTATRASASDSTRRSVGNVSKPTISTDGGSASTAKRATAAADKGTASRSAAPARTASTANNAAKPASARTAQTAASSVKPAATRGAVRQPSNTAGKSDDRAAKETAATTAVKSQSAAKSSAAAKRSVAADGSVKQERAKRVSQDGRFKDTKRSSARSANGGAAAKTNDAGKKKKIFILAGIAVLLCIVITLSIVLTVVVRNNKRAKAVYSPAYATTTRVGYSSEYLGTVERKLPTLVSDEGRSTIGYPKYGYTLKECLGTDADKVALRNAIIGESSYLTTVNTWNGGGGGYNRMDADGRLYMNDEDTGRVLYKHTASVGLYLGDVADDEPAVVKRFTFEPRGYDGYAVTGLYAPAGEVIKIEISEQDMKNTGGVVVHIGQALYNGKANNIWTAKNQMNRMPVILNTMLVDTNTATLEDGVYTAYVGSFMGGPLYIRNEGARFSVTVSGAVKYSHFILGYTTPDEFAYNAKSSAPYFDLEVWEFGVLHSGPKKYAEQFDYEDIYKAAVLWDKISLVSTQVRNQGIVFLYDPFVAAGAAVAFPGQRSVNCPMGWMSNSLNYGSFVNSGAWGNMHEYNHNFQGWGLGGGGEVTNNAMTLVEYSLFTKISAARKLGASGDGMGGWNRYTSATFALDDITASKFGNGRAGLSGYATVLHNFGQETFIKAVKGSGGQSPDKWLRSCTAATHNDFTYYINEMLGFETSDGALSDEQKEYPVFVPVASTYQTGRSYLYDGEKRDIKTMQPYVIKYGAEFDLDLNQYRTSSGINTAGGMYESGSIVLPNGFSFKVKSVSQPEYGSITEKGNGIYTYTPDKDHLESGDIRVTLEIKKNDGAFLVDDVDLIIELEQTHEIDKNMLERTVYKYEQGASPTTAREAFENGYDGHIEKTTGDNANPIQNGNTEIWSYDLLPNDTFYEVSGKFHIDETAKYRIALRGRWSCALFISVNGEDDYKLAAEINTTQTHSNFYPNDDRTYTDLTDLEAGDWLYFKAVLKGTHNGGTNSYIGVGWGKFIPPQGVIDEDGNVVGGGEETISIQYATAYRNSYEFPDHEFLPDYFYTRDYKYTYSHTDRYGKDQSVTGTNYEPWTNDVEEGYFDISHLFDGDATTNIHTGKGFSVSQSNPFWINVDMGETVTANVMTLYGRTDRNLANNNVPKSFTVEFKDADNNTVCTKEFTGLPKTGRDVIAKLGEDVTFRYYSLVVTESYGGGVALNYIDFAHEIKYANGKITSVDSDDVSFKGEWSSESCLSTFGHIYRGSKRASVEFRFSGNRFAFMTTDDPDSCEFEVYVDGKKIGAGNTRNAEGRVAYLSGELSDKDHTVRIVCKKGVLKVDSFVAWQAEKEVV